MLIDSRKVGSCFREFSPISSARQSMMRPISVVFNRLDEILGRNDAPGFIEKPDQAFVEGGATGPGHLDHRLKGQKNIPPVNGAPHHRHDLAVAHPDRGAQRTVLRRITWVALCPAALLHRKSPLGPGTDWRERAKKR